MTDVSIQMTCGRLTYVDEADRHLAEFKWSLRGPKSRYAIRYVPRTPKSGRTHILLHNEIMQPPIGLFVDHIDGDGLNNRRGNLRICTSRQNGCNRQKQALYGGTSTSSKYKGVYWDKSRRLWAASVKWGDRRVYLGRFVSEEDAARAYNAAALDLHGSFAVINNFGNLRKKAREEDYGLKPLPGLRERREAVGLSRAQLEKISRVSVPTIHRLETKDRRANWVTRKKIISALTRVETDTRRSS